EAGLEPDAKGLDPLAILNFAAISLPLVQDQVAGAVDPVPAPAYFIQLLASPRTLDRERSGVLAELIPTDQQAADKVRPEYAVHLGIGHCPILRIGGVNKKPMFAAGMNAD